MEDWEREEFERKLKLEECIRQGEKDQRRRDIIGWVVGILFLLFWLGLR
jgi:hypothetical protein